MGLSGQKLACWITSLTQRYWAFRVLSELSLLNCNWSLSKFKLARHMGMACIGLARNAAYFAGCTIFRRSGSGAILTPVSTERFFTPSRRAASAPNIG